MDYDYWIDGDHILRSLRNGNYRLPRTAPRRGSGERGLETNRSGLRTDFRHLLSNLHHRRR